MAKTKAKMLTQAEIDALVEPLPDPQRKFLHLASGALTARFAQLNKEREQQGLPPLDEAAPTHETLGEEWIKRIVEGLYLSQEMTGQA